MGPPTSYPGRKGVKTRFAKRRRAGSPVATSPRASKNPRDDGEVFASLSRHASRTLRFNLLPGTASRPVVAIIMILLRQRILLCCLLLVAMLPALPGETSDGASPAASAPEAKVAIIEEVRVGLAPGAAVARQLGWFPLWVDLKTDRKPFKGTLEVWFHSVSRDIHEVAVDMPAMARNRAAVYLRKPIGRDPLVIRLLDPLGTTVEEHQLRSDLASYSANSSLTWSFEVTPEQTMLLVLTEEDPPSAGLLSQIKRGGLPGGGSANSMPGALAPPAFHPAYQELIDHTPGSQFVRRSWSYGGGGIVGVVGPPDASDSLLGMRQSASMLQQGIAQLLPQPFRTRWHFIDAQAAPAARGQWWSPDYYNGGTLPALSFSANTFAATIVPAWYKLRWLHGHPDFLPTLPLGYDTADAVVLDGADPGRFSTVQQRALLDWVRTGGILVLTAGGNETWLGTWLEEVAPALPGPAALRAFPAGDPDRPGPLDVFEGFVLSVSAATTHPESETLASLGGEPVIAARPLGLGKVVFLGISLRQAASRGAFRSDRRIGRGISPFEVGMGRSDRFIDAWLPRSRARPRPQPNAINVFRTQETLYGAVRPRLMEPDAVFVTGLLFLIFSIPVNAWLCRRARRPLLFWPVFLGFCVAGSAGIYVALSVAGMNEVKMAQATFVEAEMDAPRARALGFFSLGSGYPRYANLSFTGARGDAPIFHQSIVADLPAQREIDLYYLNKPVQEAEETVTQPWLQTPDGPRPGPARVRTGMGRVQMLVADATLDLGGGIAARLLPVEQDLAPATAPATPPSPIAPGLPTPPAWVLPAERRIELTNNTPWTLSRLLLHEPPANYHAVPDLAPGATAVVDLGRPWWPSDSPLPNEEDGETRLNTFVAQHPELFDRLASLRRGQQGGPSRPSLARLLLSVGQENLTFYSTAESVLRQFNAAIFHELPRDGVRMRHFLPTDRPDDALYLTGTIQASPLAPLLDGKPLAADAVTLLRLRLPWACIPGAGRLRNPTPPALDNLAKAATK